MKYFKWDEKSITLVDTKCKVQKKIVDARLRGNYHPRRAVAKVKSVILMIGLLLKPRQIPTGDGDVHSFDSDCDDLFKTCG